MTVKYIILRSQSLKPCLIIRVEQAYLEAAVVKSVAVVNRCKYKDLNNRIEISGTFHFMLC